MASHLTVSFVVLAAVLAAFGHAQIPNPNNLSNTDLFISQDLKESLQELAQIGRSIGIAAQNNENATEFVPAALDRVKFLSVKCWIINIPKQRVQKFLGEILLLSLN